MGKIAFVYKWQKPRQSSWSGTPFGIFNALNRHCEVVDRPIEFSFMDKVVFFIYKLFGKYKWLSDFGIMSSKLRARHLRQMTIGEDETVLLFGELYSQYIGRSYIYQDCTVNYLVDFGANGDKNLIKYMTIRPDASKRAIAKRLKLVNRFYEDCAGMFTMSQYLCDYMKNSGVIAPGKVHFAGGGCNVDASRVDNSRKTGNKFLFVGKTFEGKNGFLTVKAFKMLRKKYPEAQLYIAGPQSEEECGELGDGIVFLGRLNYDRLVDYYNLCDYFVMPSKFEGYGIVFGEALIYGLPCIGKNCFAMPEFIEENVNGYLIQNDDEHELAEKMEQMHNNKDMAKYVLEHREHYIEKYSWDSVAKRICEVIGTEKM